MVAAGAWSGALAPGRAAGAPGEGPDPRAAHARGAAAIRSTGSCARPRCYLVGRGDGRVVLGATMEEQGFDTTVTAGGVYRLLEAAWEVLPETGELELRRARAPACARARPTTAPVDRRGRARRARLGHRALPQRRPAGPAHRRRRWPSLLAGGEPDAVAGLAPDASCRGGGRDAVRSTASRADLPDGATVAEAVRERRASRTAAAWPWRSTARWCRAAQWDTHAAGRGPAAWRSLQAVQGG